MPTGESGNQHGRDHCIGQYIATSETTIAPGPLVRAVTQPWPKARRSHLMIADLWELLATGAEAFLKSGKRD